MVRVMGNLTGLSVLHSILKIQCMSVIVAITASPSSPQRVHLCHHLAAREGRKESFYLLVDSQWTGMEWCMCVIVITIDFNCSRHMVTAHFITQQSFPIHILMVIFEHCFAF